MTSTASKIQDALAKKKTEGITVLSNKEPEAPAPVPRLKGIRLHQIIRKDGTVWKPNEEGFFVPSNEQEFEMCRYYVEIGRLILDPAQAEELQLKPF
jgi:hypothetical protein